MSTTVEHLEQVKQLKARAETLRANAWHLLNLENDWMNAAERLDEQARKLEHTEAMRRVSVVLDELQSTDEGAEAVMNLVLSAADDYNSREAEWSSYTKRLFAGFAVVFTLDRAALEAWVSDVASDLAPELAENDVSEREAGKEFLKTGWKVAK